MKYLGLESVETTKYGLICTISECNRERPMQVLEWTIPAPKLDWLQQAAGMVFFIPVQKF